MKVLHRAGWIGALAAACLACATGRIPVEELPEEPIAALFWEREPARRRAELIAQNKGDIYQPPEGVATVDALADLVGGGSREQRPLKAQLAQWPGRLVLIDPRSGDVRRVEGAPRGARPLAWSAGHERLLFTTGHISGEAQLYEFFLETGEIRTVTRGPESHPIGDYGPDGRLVYTGLRRIGRDRVRVRLYVTGPGGGAAEVVEEGVYHPAVRLHPSGDFVVAVAPAPGSGKGSPVLVEIPLSGDGTSRVLGRGVDPVLSRDGRWLLYTGRTRSGELRIVRSRADGAGRTVLSEGRDQKQPAISPDGRFVVSAGKEGEFEYLFVRRIDGSGERVVLETGSVAWPVW